MAISQTDKGALNWQTAKFGAKRANLEREGT